MSIKIYIFGKDVFCRIYIWSQMLLLKPPVHENNIFFCPIFALTRLKMLCMVHNWYRHQSHSSSNYTNLKQFKI